jgi:ATP-dependent Clp protease adaptor protein ClpS
MNEWRLETITLPEIAPEIAPAEEIGDSDEHELRGDKPWNVVLLDDNMHTYDYVIEMLQKIFGYSLEIAFLMAVIVDNAKRVVVATCSFEKAEARQQQIHDYGPDWRIPGCKGSMRAVLEKVE